MTDYEKLKGIIDEVDVLIEKQISSSDADFQAWKTKAERFLIKKFGKDSLEYTKFKETHFSLTMFYLGTPDSEFVEACRRGLETTKAVFLTYLEGIEEEKVDTTPLKVYNPTYEKVFIVHGHDGELKEAVARIIEKQGINAIILSEQANKGRTIIEKFEDYSDVGGAICLFTADDYGRAKTNETDNTRARQNVVLETGYGKTLLYCKSPGKAAEYSIQLSERSESDVFDSYPEGFKEFIAHIQKEYDVNHSIDEWSLIKVLKKGFGIHHGKLPKYIQQEILEQFNKGTFDVLFCTSTIVEGVNTDAQNMIILNASKGRNKLTPFDIKNIKGRAGRYYHCFIGRVFYMTRELERIEMSESFSLDFVTYSDKELGVIDLDNADIQDLTQCNQSRKTSRSHEIDKFIVPREVFIKNRMVSWENQNSLALTLQKDEEFDKYIRWISYPVDVDNFLHYNWIAKILNTFHMAKLIDENTKKRYAAIAHDYHTGGFKEILKYEIGEYRKGKRKTIDDAYARAFNARKDILEHKIPKMLSLFESIIVFVAQSHGISMDGFSLSRVRRYYETGVKTPLGEALMEYGFPVDAIRNLEDKFDQLRNLDLTESKTFCRQHYKEIISVFDSYEIDLFIRAMNSI